MDGGDTSGDHVFSCNDSTAMINNPAAENLTLENNSALLVSNDEQQNQLISYKQMLSIIFELTDEDLAKVEEHLRDKLIRNGEIFLQQHDTLRSNYEKFKIEYEQRFVDLESEFNECQNKLTQESKNSYLFRQKANENGKHAEF